VTAKSSISAAAYRPTSALTDDYCRTHAAAPRHPSIDETNATFMMTRCNQCPQLLRPAPGVINKKTAANRDTLVLRTLNKTPNIVADICRFCADANV